MESTNMFKSASRNSQLLLLDQKCAKCLLETYVKRSLSLNEGCKKHQLKQLKMVRRNERGSQARRASSDPSKPCLSAERLPMINQCPECTTSASDLLCKDLKAPKSQAKGRSALRSFRNFFSKKKSDLKVNREGVSETDCGQSTTERGVGTSRERSSPGRTETLRKKHSLKKIVFSDQHVEQRESLPTDSTPVPGGVEGLSDVCADSSNTYFERVSEELEWIVNEIQFSPKDDSAPLPSSACVGDSRSAGDDNTERIISLLKQHGDIIDQKISKNKGVQDFLQKLTYSSFQQMADRYISQIPSPLPQTTDASPELVKLAFTLDFTAKVAGLCSQTVGRIMGFGNQYLQDSFTQMCAAHRQVPEDLEGQNTCDPD